MGGLLYLLPFETIIALIVWFVSAKTIKISSLSSLIGLGALVIASFIIHPHMAHAPIILIAVILVYKHIPNIIRIIKGEEKRLV
jgi:glycerol-3-phosphate acyltransferase PlsY